MCCCMLLSIVVNWGLGLLVDRFRNRPGEKAVLLVTVVYNLGVLFLFKYLNFTVNNLNLLFRSDIRVPQIALPVGISFYTFQAMSYVLDVHRGKGEAQKNPLNVGLYIALFPQLIAGPIVRYETVAWQIGHRQETLHGFYEGILRFIYGFGKKILLANTLALGGTPASAPLRSAICPSVPPGWGRFFIPCRSCLTSPATPTWPSAWAKCSASSFWKTSTIRTFPERSRNSGAAGTFL